MFRLSHIWEGRMLVYLLICIYLFIYLFMAPLPRTLPIGWNQQGMDYFACTV